MIRIENLLASKDEIENYYEVWLCDLVRDVVGQVVVEHARLAPCFRVLQLVCFPSVQGTDSMSQERGHNEVEFAESSSPIIRETVRSDECNGSSSALFPLRTRNRCLFDNLDGFDVRERSSARWSASRSGCPVVGVD